MTGPFELIKPVPTAKAQEILRAVRDGRKARLQRDAQIRRQRVLDAACTLMAEVGLHSLNMRDLGAKVGYSAGALYSYFPSREHLLAAMRQQLLRELTEEQTRAIKPTGKQGARSAARSDGAVTRDAYEVATLGWWQPLCHDPQRLALLLHTAGTVLPGPSGDGAAQPDLLDELFEATRVALGCLGSNGGAVDGESSDLSGVHREVLSLAIGLLVTKPSALGTAEGCAVLSARLLSAMRLLRSAMLGFPNSGEEGAGGLQVDLFGQSPLK
ncbi:MAG TPA: TetR/AcrR family transcriptional regulator [Hydrogenophaga sp.]